MTTIWPGVTDLMTSTPTARFFTCSTKARATSSATSASSSARRTSRSAASTSCLRQRAAPRQAVENAAESCSDRLSNNVRLLSIGHDAAGTKHVRARGRIALSGGDLRPHWTGRRMSIPALFESGRNIGAGPRIVNIWGRVQRSQAVKSPCYGRQMGLDGAIRSHPLAFLFGLAAVSLLGLLFVPPIPQPQIYHRFADQRTLLGIPNFWNVVSNLPFILVGALGPAILPPRPVGRRVLPRRVPDRVQLVLLPLEAERRRPVLGPPADVGRVHGDPGERRSRSGSTRRVGQAAALAAGRARHRQPAGVAAGPTTCGSTAGCSSFPASCCR